MNLFHINLEDIMPTSSIWTKRMLRVIHSDDQVQAVENPNPIGGKMLDARCLLSKRTNFCKGGE